MNGRPAGLEPFLSQEAEIVQRDADQAIATCGGDARVAVQALVAMVDHLKAELAERDDAIAALTASVSRGYARGFGERPPPGARDKVLRKPVE
ncbi:hypothetical protein [Labrys neptuniae]|uniref:Uncharacterized protein n=1 Tax=Labrys neptuniae TaxID=376174 RepID=A0ABV3PGX0_9HYPH